MGGYGGGNVFVWPAIVMVMESILLNFRIAYNLEKKEMQKKICKKALLRPIYFFSYFLVR